MAAPAPPDYVQLSVTALAYVHAPTTCAAPGGADPAIVLADGSKIKFWVCAELHQPGQEPRNLTDAELRAMDVHLEPDGGEVVGL